jgi:enoyl-[acyl-carrier protein] reductase II
MNKICSLFNIKYPIIQVEWFVSGYKLASTVSNAGGLGLIGDLDVCPWNKRTYSKCKKSNTAKPWVNVPMLYPNIEEIWRQRKVLKLYLNLGRKSQNMDLLFKRNGITVVQLLVVVFLR